MAERAYRIDLTVRSPVLCQGLAPSGLGIDASFIRDEVGRPIIPSDHLKGLLRAAFTHRFPHEAQALFGRESPEGEGNRPARGRVFLSDLTLTGELPQASTSTRIAIDPDTGTAADGALQVIELIAPCEARLSFIGEMVVAGLPDQDLDEDADRLLLAFRSIPAVGALKSIGFGEVVDVRMVPTTRRSPPPPSFADGLAFEVTFDRPILVDAERLSANVFRSSSVIPGAVFKGALAEKLKRLGRMATDLSADLSTIIIGHGFPLDRDGRPMGHAPPRSLVAGNGRIGSAILAEDGQGVVIDGKVAAYQPDWKGPDHCAARKALAWSEADLGHFVQRTRIAVDASGVAADGQLFVHQGAPSLTSTGDPQRWRFEVQRQGIAEASWRLIVEAMTDGLLGVGKTDATMSVASVQPVPGREAPRPLKDSDGSSWWAVTLETPALMLDPSQPWDAGQQYRDYWRWAFEQLGSSARPELRTWFTHEILHGGYEAVRRGLFGAGQYGALALTAPGSVFLLADGDGVASALETALRIGLPPRPPVPSGRARLTWEDTTFVPENGYGRIAFHHDAHAALAKVVEIV